MVDQRYIWFVLNRDVIRHVPSTAPLYSGGPFALDTLKDNVLRSYRVDRRWRRYGSQQEFLRPFRTIDDVTDVAVVTGGDWIFCSLSGYARSVVLLSLLDKSEQYTIFTSNIGNFCRFKAKYSPPRTSADAHFGIVWVGENG